MISLESNSRIISLGFRGSHVVVRVCVYVCICVCNKQLYMQLVYFFARTPPRGQHMWKRTMVLKLSVEGEPARGSSAAALFRLAGHGHSRLLVLTDAPLKEVGLALE